MIYILQLIKTIYFLQYRMEQIYFIIFGFDPSNLSRQVKHSLRKSKLACTRWLMIKCKNKYALNTSWAYFFAQKLMLFCMKISWLPISPSLPLSLSLYIYIYIERERIKIIYIYIYWRIYFTWDRWERQHVTEELLVILTKTKHAEKKTLFYMTGD